MKKSDLLAYYQAQKVNRERMYTKPFRRYQRRRRLETITALVQQAGGAGRHDRILDVGCEDGYGSAVILDGVDYAQFIGLDLSFDKLRAARCGLHLSHMVMGDAEELPFANTAVDVTFSLETREHLPDPGGALGEIARVLKPGSVLFLSVPVSSTLNAVLAGWWMRFRRGGRFREHLQVYTLKRLITLLRSAGLQSREHRFCVFNFPCYEILTRLIPYRLWRRLDVFLSRWRLGFVGVKLGFSFGLGNDYLVVKAEKAADDGRDATSLI